jgi:hypothetical protein
MTTRSFLAFPAQPAACRPISYLVRPSTRYLFDCSFLVAVLWDRKVLIGLGRRYLLVPAVSTMFGMNITERRTTAVEWMHRGRHVELGQCWRPQNPTLHPLVCRTASGATKKITTHLYVATSGTVAAEVVPLQPFRRARLLCFSGCSMPSGPYPPKESQR